MNWKQIDKIKRVQNKGVYTSWKQQIANECFNQCVYCSIHESPWGGIDHYHIDHFRPQSKFGTLKNIITNLYYSCPICNKFKSDDWQNEPNDLNVICYPDPSEHNYSDLFDINSANYTLEGKYISSKYLINRLYLNRPQLIFERREVILTLKFKAVIAKATKLINDCDDQASIGPILSHMLKLSTFLLTRSNVPPYKLLDIKKLKKKK